MLLDNNRLFVIDIIYNVCDRQLIGETEKAPEYTIRGYKEQIRLRVKNKSKNFRIYLSSKIINLLGRGINNTPDGGENYINENYFKVHNANVKSYQPNQCRQTTYITSININ